MGIMVKYPYRRNIKARGLDVYKVYAVIDGRLKLVKPVGYTRSRTGAHGEDIYDLTPGQRYLVIHYYRSSSGATRDVNIDLIEVDNKIRVIYNVLLRPGDDVATVAWELAKHDINRGDALHILEEVDDFLTADNEPCHPIDC